MPKHRFSDDQILAAWTSAGSINATLRQLGMSSGGRSSAQLRARLQRLGVSMQEARTRPWVLYPREQLAEAAASSRSVAEVVRRIGARQTGGTQAHISRRLKHFSIDTSHFTGQAHMRGRVSARRRSAEVVLVVLPDGSPRPRGRVLRRALHELGRLELCEECGLSGEWNSRPLRLEIDHVSGDWLDNRPENLRFLCPNCHSQTPTFGRRALVEKV